MLQRTTNSIRFVRTLSKNISSTTFTGALIQQRSIRFNVPNINGCERSVAIMSSYHQSSLIQKRFYASNEVTVKVPEMGESVTEGQILKWIYNVGDSFGEDHVVVQIETDKVTADVRAPQPGTLTKQLKKEKDTVNVGEPLFSFTPGSGSAPKQEAPKATPAPESKPQPTEQKLQEAPKTSPASESKQQPTPSASHGKRVPLIQFRYGKRDAPKKTQQQSQPTSYSTGPKTDPGPMKKGVPYVYYQSFTELPPQYARSSLSAAEMETIEVRSFLKFLTCVRVEEYHTLNLNQKWLVANRQESNGL
jgi:biotin carboxyl carrier protein